MMNMKNNQTNISIESGFTLIEILVTLTILTLTMPALVRSFGQAQREQALSENKTTALYLLKYQMALIESEGFPEIGSDNGEFGEGSRYTWTSEISDVDLQQLRVHGFSEEDAWDIASIAAFFALSNRMANFAGMRPNDDFYTMGREERSNKKQPKS